MSLGFTCDREHLRWIDDTCRTQKESLRERLESRKVPEETMKVGSFHSIKSVLLWWVTEEVLPLLRFVSFLFWNKNLQMHLKRCAATAWEGKMTALWLWKQWKTVLKAEYWHIRIAESLPLRQGRDKASLYCLIHSTKVSSKVRCLFAEQDPERTLGDHVTLYKTTTHLASPLRDKQGPASSWLTLICYKQNLSVCLGLVVEAGVNSVPCGQLILLIDRATFTGSPSLVIAELLVVF